MYAVQVCMPGKSYETVKGWGSLWAQLDRFISIARGTHFESRKGMMVRLITRETDVTRIGQTGPWRVIRRAKVA